MRQWNDETASAKVVVSVADRNTCQMLIRLQETVDHLFISCQFATSVWEAAPFSNVQATLGTTHFTSALQASLKLVNLPPTGVHLVSLFPWIVWTIWLIRNQRIFHNREFDGRATLTKATTDAREWQQAQQEALAIREALLQARGHGHINIAIRSGAQILIRAINGRDQIKGLYGILQDIHNLTCYLSTSVFSFISRKDNVAADNLAKKVLFNFFNCM
ncbi:uncharacterized protein LOC125586243 [Brassica napus]|uniref:uncharacterized protein LOC125586243 n=1 Tax=Brassica napus TaxID=3708 RepID=UPI00207A1648|nr:uncharacterized protein LOC125586243 [Brassica napus]